MSPLLVVELARKVNELILREAGHAAPVNGNGALTSASAGDQAAGGGGADMQVLRAVALHQCCVCHEHLGQRSTALTEARRALKLARHVLPSDDHLIARLHHIESSMKVPVDFSRPSTSPATVGAVAAGL